jgi:hypothetical protein
VRYSPDNVERLKMGGVVFALDPDVIEKEEQAKIAELAKAYGFVVRSTSQARPSKITVGLADLILMRPGEGHNGFALWWETKRQVGGVQSPDQAAFERDCRACGWTYRLGHRYDFARYLLQIGLAAEGDGPCGIIPTVRKLQRRYTIEEVS